jgi:hypothetical protein
MGWFKKEAVSQLEDRKGIFIEKMSEPAHPAVYLPLPSPLSMNH